MDKLEACPTQMIRANSCPFVANPILLIDVGNTNTHIGIATEQKILSQTDIPTALLSSNGLHRALAQLRRRGSAVSARKSAPNRGGDAVPAIRGATIASVVPKMVPVLRAGLRRHFAVTPIVVSADIPLGVKVDYPNKEQIGADRLANAVGVFKLYGAPAVVVDFGTAVTFDIVDKRGAYIGGVIAPGLAAMTDYLYQRTALLPKIDLAEPRSMIGKNTVQAMQIGAVVGYRGLIKEILADVKRELRAQKLHVVATGGYSKLIAKKIPDIQHVNSLLTLEGLRFIYLLNR
jgi:type III pantothenate kinase